MPMEAASASPDSAAASESWPSDTTSLAAAMESEENKLVSMQYPKLQQQFYASINEQKAELEALVCAILGVPTCRIIPASLWRSGSFNVAILARLPFGRNVYLRLPFLHRVGEHTFRGNAEEKLRTEVATYLWLRENCPDVPTPTLYAFGLPDGSVFARPENSPWWRRVWWQLGRLYAFLLGHPIPIKHVQNSIRHRLSSGFLLLSEAEGKSLALTWHKHCHDERRRENLFRGLAQVSLSMNAFPQPRIGSFLLNSDHSISLSNRPLSLYMQMTENDGVQSGIPRQRTYSEADSYLSDLLSLQDHKLREQPNSMLDVDDGRRQMAALAALRATTHLFLDPDRRQGPFYLTLSDMHQNNIFVDDKWNVKGIIDLEWTHTLPAEMQTPPHWLTSRPVDGLKEPRDMEEYEQALEEYLAIYKEEEVKRHGRATHAELQRETWRRGGFWFYKAVTIPKGMYNLFNRHIQPMFNAEHPDMQVFDDVFYWYWGAQAASQINTKLQAREEYINTLREAHHAARGD